MRLEKLDEKQKPIEIERVLVRYFHARGENYRELIVVEIVIDRCPRKFDDNLFDSYFVKNKAIIVATIRLDIDLTSSNLCFTFDCTLSYCLERQSALAGVA